MERRRLPRLLRHLISESAFCVALAIAIVSIALATAAQGQEPSVEPGGSSVELLPPGGAPEDVLAEPEGESPAGARARFLTEPSGARVEFEGVTLGLTPLEIAMPSGSEKVLLRLDGYIPMLCPLEDITRGNDQVMRVELIPEVDVPHGFDPETVAPFLGSRIAALSLMEEVAERLADAHVDQPRHHELLARGGRAILEGIEALRSRVQRRQKVLAPAELMEIYGAMVDLGAAEPVEGSVRTSPTESILEVKLGDSSTLLLPFASDLDECRSSLQSLFDLVRQHYDPSGAQISDDALCVLGIRGMLASIGDPYSRYFPPATEETYLDDRSGFVSGVGLHLGLDSEGAVIVRGVLAGGPAALQGIEVGDALVSIGSDSTLPFDLDGAVHGLRGPAGSAIDLTIGRSGKVLGPISVERELVPLRCTACYYFSGCGAGYMRLDGFPGTWTVAEFQQGLEAILDEGATSLVIDVRGNAGGLLDQAAAIADLFVDEGTLVTTRSPLPQMKNTLSARETTTVCPPDVAVAILVDGGTASAAEILAGSLRDHGRASLIGEKTYGKGSVQIVLPLTEPRGSIAITVGRYYLPLGESVHGQGVTPDVVVPVEDAVRQLVRERSLYSTRDPRDGDPQLEAALVHLALQDAARRSPQSPQSPQSLQSPQSPQSLQSPQSSQSPETPPQATAAPEAGGSTASEEGEPHAGSRERVPGERKP